MRINDSKCRRTVILRNYMQWGSFGNRSLIYDEDIQGFKGQYYRSGWMVVSCGFGRSIQIVKTGFLFIPCIHLPKDRDFCQQNASMKVSIMVVVVRPRCTDNRELCAVRAGWTSPKIPGGSCASLPGCSFFIAADNSGFFFLWCPIIRDSSFYRLQ